MASYILRRLLLMVPTIFGIMVVAFVVIQLAPGGPIDRIIAQLNGSNVDTTARFSGSGSDFRMQQPGSLSGADHGVMLKYRGAQGLDPKYIESLEKQFGFDKPPLERFWILLSSYVQFDFGQSFFKDKRVIDLIIEKLPVSISLGIWMTLLSYMISIPLGIRKAVNDGSNFDVWSSAIVIVGYAVPGFLVGVALLILFGGGSFFDWFPSRGLFSENWEELTWFEKIKDYFWHLTLPLIALSLSSFATLTFLTKNSFLDEIKKQYVITARAKGLSEKGILYGHVFRNAMLLVIAGFPAAFVGAFFTGSLLIENVFNLDGFGYLSWDSVMSRDYPVVFASIYIFALIGLIVNLISDLTYTWIDPRIDFESREV